MSTAGDSTPDRTGTDESVESTTVDLTRFDKRALSYLASVDDDYPALIAANTGLHDDLLERRLATMREAGLVERVDTERIFRITPAGRDVVAQ